MYTNVWGKKALPSLFRSPSYSLEESTVKSLAWIHPNLSRAQTITYKVLPYQHTYICMNICLKFFSNKWDNAVYTSLWNLLLSLICVGWTSFPWYHVQIFLIFFNSWIKYSVAHNLILYWWIFGFLKNIIDIAAVIILIATFFSNFLEVKRLGHRISVH